MISFIVLDYFYWKTIELFLSFNSYTLKLKLNLVFLFVLCVVIMLKNTSQLFQSFTHCLVQENLGREKLGREKLGRKDDFMLFGLEEK